MDPLWLARRAGRVVLWYAVIDLVLGPLAVGAAFLGFVVWVFGMAGTLHYGLPWLPTMVAVGLTWAAIGLGAWRAGNRVVIAARRVVRP